MHKRQLLELGALANILLADILANPPSRDPGVLGEFTLGWRMLRLLSSPKTSGLARLPELARTLGDAAVINCLGKTLLATGFYEATADGTDVRAVPVGAGGT